jgi:hypothetical protein
MPSWLDLMEANREVKEATSVLVEFCQRRATDPRRLTIPQRSRMLRLVERLEETTSVLTDMITNLVSSEELLGNGPNPRTRDEVILGMSLLAPRAIQVGTTDDELATDATSTTTEPPLSPAQSF